MTALLPLTLACGDYDRTRALADGRVTVDGVTLDCRLMSTGPMLAGAAREEFDVVEHSLATIVMQHGEHSPYVALPVFPSRMFRQNGIYVRADAEFAAPDELRGSRVGISGYTVTGMLWIRGMLADHYGLPVDSVVYVNGGLDSPGAPPMRGAVPPLGVVVEEAPPTTTLSELLISGDLDAVYALHAPAGFHQRPQQIRRLFSDVRAEERWYFEETGFFPLMHVLAVRREVFESNRWLAPALASAFASGVGIAREELSYTGALHVLLPWSYVDLAEAEQLMGDGLWADGVELNLKNLETFVRYASEQGLIPNAFDPRMLFPIEAR